MTFVHVETKAGTQIVNTALVESVSLFDRGEPAKGLPAWCSVRLSSGSSVIVKGDLAAVGCLLGMWQLLTNPPQPTVQLFPWPPPNSPPSPL